MVIKGRCPFCHGDVAGNDRHRYYCARCNLLFDKKHLQNPCNPFGSMK